ncbi:MAG: putative 2-dehydropantoate 2-reductase [Planctomycetales bacterium]|nr:putative 2-dehydropantoate 2-reductase [Planctomycetales bacterium]
MKSYAILGTGALGGLYGGLLAKSGCEVHFLARSDFQHIRRSGLRVDSPLGDFHLPHPSVFDDPQDMPKVDVAVVAWKATCNDSLGEVLRAVCDQKSLVLVLQNGYDIERDAADVAGENQVLGGCCFLCSNKIGPGHIKHLDYGRIAFGEYSPSWRGRISPRMLEIAEDFQRAGIDMQPAEDLQSVRWRKLVWNVPFNGLSVVLRANTQQIMSDPSARMLAESLMIDICRASKQCGTEIERAHIDKMLIDTEKMVPYDSSMSLDYLAKRPMEVEAIFGNPWRAALSAGYRATYVETLYRQLLFLDAHNQSN